MTETNRVRSSRTSTASLSLTLLVLVALGSQITSVATQGLRACNLLSTTGDKSGACVCNDGNNASVRCVNTAGLVQIPDDILPNVSLLAIQDGNVRVLIEDEFSEYGDITVLALERLQIYTIHEHAFRNLYKLKTLSLQGNRLTTFDLSGKTFQFLTSLNTIDVSRNSITAMGRYSFMTILPVVQGSRLDVYLQGNEIKCGCDVVALRQWLGYIDNKKFKLANFICANDPEKKEYDQIPITSYKSCITSGVQVNEAATCLECDNLKTNHECRQSRPVFCPNGQRCKRTVSYDSSTGLKINSRCQRTDVCALESFNNKDTCFPGNNDFHCQYCCVDAICGLKSPVGRTRDYEYDLLYTVRRKGISIEMFDSASPAYDMEAKVEIEQLVERTKEFKGGVFFQVTRIEPDTSSSIQIRARVFVTVFDWKMEHVVFANLTARFSSLSHGVIQATLKRIKNAKCPAEKFIFNGISLTWPETFTDDTARILCTDPNNFDPGQYATRKCLEPIINQAQWGEENKNLCYDYRPSTREITTSTEKTTPSTKRTTATTTTMTSTTKTTNTTKRTTTTAIPLVTLPTHKASYTPQEAQKTTSLVLKYMKDSKSLDSADVANVVDTLVNLSSDEDNIVFENVSESVLECVNEVVDKLENSEDPKKTSTRLLNVIDKVAANAPLTKGKFEFSSPNLAIAARAVTPTETRDLLFSEIASSDDNIETKLRYTREASTPETDYTNIVIPMQSMLKTLTPSEKQSLQRMTFSMHRDSKLFDSLESPREQNSVKVRDDDGDVRIVRRQVNGRVLSASVPGIKIENLPDNITMTFQHADENATNPGCVYWDPDLRQGSGDWSTRGCGVVRSDEKSTTCGCNHLTNFALLMDVYQEGESLSTAHREALSIISYIGCSVSLLTLILTLITYSLFRKLRRDTPSKILINLCLALGMSNLIFLAGMHDYTFENETTCKIVAALLHYSLLASLTWMVVEAFYMYLALVIVFKTYFSKFLLKISLFGWGVPLVVVIITLCVNLTDNYGMIGSGLCWIKTPAFYYAFVAPVALIILLNFIAFFLVIKQLMKMSSTKLNTSDRYGTMQRLRGAVGVVILLGLTWVFAVFAIDSASVVFYYLFAIFNSLQGLFIFIFYCVFKADAAASWRRCLTCQPDDFRTSGTGGTSSNTANANRRKSSTGSALNSANTNSTVVRGDNSNEYDSINHSNGPRDPTHMNMPQSSKNAPPNSKLRTPKQQGPDTMMTKFTSNVADENTNHVYNNNRGPTYSANVQVTGYPSPESQPSSPVHSSGSPGYGGHFIGPSQSVRDYPVDPNLTSVKDIRLRFEIPPSSVGNNRI